MGSGSPDPATETAFVVEALDCPDEELHLSGTLLIAQTGKCKPIEESHNNQEIQTEKTWRA